MKMRESDIFNNYVKLAQDAGLISDEDMQKTADPNDKFRRDSYTFTDIEALYGHKFTPNDKEGETISDVAHPDTAVVGPAYDAMNAVIENIQQRNDIMTYIALKDPDGHLVQRRYVAAQQKLINSLVSVGFKMDSLEEAGLMSLADSCAGRIHKKAIAPLAWAAVSLLGGLGYLAYGSTSVQNVAANSQLVLERLSELTAKPYASKIQPEVEALKELAVMFMQSKNTIVANSLSEVVTQAGTEKANAMIDLIEKYKAQEDKVMKLIPSWIVVIQTSLQSDSPEASSDAVEKLKSFISTVTPDAMQAYFQDGGEADERELIDELKALAGAIKDSKTVIAGVENMAKGYAPQIEKEVKAKEEKPVSYDIFEQNKSSKPAQPAQPAQPSQDELNEQLMSHVQNNVVS